MIIERALDKRITQEEAADVLNISERQNRIISILLTLMPEQSPLFFFYNEEIN